MTNIHRTFQEIISELERLATPEATKNDPPYIPGLIAAGPEGSIVVNDKIEAQIRAVADWMLEQRPAAKAHHSLKEWRTAVRRAFGPALVQLDFNDPLEDNARKLKKIVEDAIDTAPAAVPCRFMTIGCTLFDKPLPSSVVIGPVLFEPKSDWLDRAVQIGQITKTTHSRLSRAFKGRRLRPRKNEILDLYERSLLEVLGHAQLACTVETEGLAPEMAQTRAIIGARLGQTAIALLWRTPSRILEGFHLSVDPGHRQIRTVPFIPGKPMIGGFQFKGQPHGPHIKDADWFELVTSERGFLDFAGRMISCWTSASAYNQASPLLRNLAQSIFFFFEGCRDENDLMSIVKFTAALEALAQGKSAGIIKLATSRLGIKENKKVVGNRTLKQVVDLIYTSGRSRTLHGTNPDIIHDWSDARAIAESLTRHCLVASMHWAEQNPTAKDPKGLLT